MVGEPPADVSLVAEVVLFFPSLHCPLLEFEISLANVGAPLLYLFFELPNNLRKVHLLFPIVPIAVR
jgi:hypothetical protein